MSDTNDIAADDLAIALAVGEIDLPHALSAVCSRAASRASLPADEQNALAAVLADFVRTDLYLQGLVAAIRKQLPDSEGQ